MVAPSSRGSEGVPRAYESALKVLFLLMPTVRDPSQRLQLLLATYQKTSVEKAPDHVGRSKVGTTRIIQVHPGTYTRRLVQNEGTRQAPRSRNR